MHDLDVILATIRHQKGDLERQIAETAQRGGETAALLEKLEELRRRLPAEDEPGKRLLVVDDDVAMLRLLQTLARREGLECDTAANGAEAVTALRARPYSMMFLDILMPRVDGWGVLDYLRTHASIRVPAIFIVTSCVGQTVSAADRELVSGIIYKPIDGADMSALMRRCVRGESAIGALQNTRHRLLATVQ